MHQRSGKLDSLLVSMRESVHLACDTVHDPQPFQPGRGSSPGIHHAHTMQLSEVLELLAHVHGRVQSPLFGHVPEAATLALADSDTIPLDGSGVQVGETEDSSHRGRLAGPVRTQETRHLPGRNRKREIVDRGDRPEATGKSFELEETTHALTLGRSRWFALIAPAHPFYGRLHELGSHFGGEDQGRPRGGQRAVA